MRTCVFVGGGGPVVVGIVVVVVNDISFVFDTPLVQEETPAFKLVFRDFTPSNPKTHSNVADLTALELCKQRLAGAVQTKL